MAGASNAHSSVLQRISLIRVKAVGAGLWIPATSVAFCADPRLITAPRTYLAPAPALLVVVCTRPSDHPVID
jgi:hypothetical protein